MKDKILAKNLEKIMDHFGISNQLRKFNEECFELNGAILEMKMKMREMEGKTPKIVERTLETYRLHIAEEIADCMVLLNQFIRKYNLDTAKIQKLFEEKINRTIKRIEEGYYD